LARSAQTRRKNSSAFTEGNFLSREAYDGRLDDLRGAIIHSGISVARLSAITRLARVTINNFLDRTTKNPRDYTIQRLREAISLPNPDVVRIKGYSRYVGAWKEEYDKKLRARQKRLDELKLQRAARRARKTKRNKKANKTKKK